MSERGFFAVDRGVFEHPMFAREPFTEVHAWLWLLAQAVWKDTRVRVGRAPIDLCRGQMAFATRFLAKRWMWSEARVRRFLKRLEIDAAVTLSATREATLITICNYDEYQTSRRTGDAPIDAQTDALATHSRRKEEEKKQDNKEEKKEETPSLRSGVARAGVSRGTSLPAEWRPSPSHYQQGGDLGFTPQAVDGFADDMRLWATANGNRAVAKKADWNATFTGWLKREQGRNPRGRGPPGGRGPSFAEIAEQARNFQNGQHRQNPEPTFDLDLQAEPGPGVRSGPR